MDTEANGVWATVIVKANGTVTVRPDDPGESNRTYHRARDGAVFEHRSQMARITPGDTGGAIQAAIDMLYGARDAAPLPR